MSKSSSLVVLVVVAVFVGILWEAKIGCAQLSAAQCKEERRIGLNQCKPVLYRKLPTPACCERVRVSHVECVCPVITPKLAALIDVNRAIRLIEGCGRRVPRHFKCGSITTP
ncbi:Bifunctional inhibitor/plant lipid transfer protein/seed storage helical domain [Melia azedarach]|uniref:Bifunctional inhibitor/plant lipid transfer protein/seed storage helical domain n=1 Tax=Melia azedarach TaxID=155640 RepID=A0ACC1XQR7_MELAZ|nr:Bifunctional inhibitor/plant lipid transfer protein/seed storage helical domain [Melia azedarach]